MPAAMLQPPFTVASSPLTAPSQGPFTQAVSMGAVPPGTVGTRALTLGELLEATAAAHPDQDAVVYADRDYRQTWRQFRQEVDRLAKGLIALGVRKGEKVAIWATNVPHWVTLQFATAQIGAVLLTLNTNCRSSEMDYLLRSREHLHHRRGARHRLPGHPL